MPSGSIRWDPESWQPWSSQRRANAAGVPAETRPGVLSPLFGVPNQGFPTLGRDSLACDFFELVRELPKVLALDQQLVVAAVVHDPTLAHHEDFVTRADTAQPMGHADHRLRAA